MFKPPDSNEIFVPQLGAKGEKYCSSDGEWKGNLNVCPTCENAACKSHRERQHSPSCEVIFPSPNRSLRFWLPDETIPILLKCFASEETHWKISNYCPTGSCRTWSQLSESKDCTRWNSKLFPFLPSMPQDNQPPPKSTGLTNFEEYHSLPSYQSKASPVNNPG